MGKTYKNVSRTSRPWQKLKKKSSEWTPKIKYIKENSNKLGFVKKEIFAFELKIGGESLHAIHPTLLHSHRD